MFKGILLPVDLNDESSWRKAAPVAVSLCNAYGCKLNVVAVAPSVGLPFVGSFFPPDFEKKMRAEMTARLAAFTAEHVPAELRGESIVAQGTIYEEIIAARKKLGDKVDLIVMASHRPATQDYLLGPNAARVVRHSQISVLVVRE